MRFSNVLLAVAAVLMLTVLPARATVMTYDVTITAPFNSFGTNYGGGTVGSGYLDGAVPIAPVTVSFDVTLDPTSNYSDATSIAGTINVPFSSPLLFNYYSSLAAIPVGSPDVVNELVIGGSGGTSGVGCTGDAADCVQDDPATNDFYVQILDFPTSPTFEQLGYTNVDSSVSGGGTYDYTLGPSGGTLTVTVVPPSSVPEPASLALLGSALFGFAAIRRRRNSA